MKRESPRDLIFTHFLLILHISGLDRVQCTCIKHMLQGDLDLETSSGNELELSVTLTCDLPLDNNDGGHGGSCPHLAAKVGTRIRSCIAIESQTSTSLTMVLKQ